MKIEILRHQIGESESYYQCFEYTSNDPAETVATMLNNLNSRENLTDIEGKPARKIAYKKSCLQKKCGSCAMLINGRPSLACDRKLVDLGEEIKLEPLKKFPVVEDLIVDRSYMQENLKAMNAYLENNALISKKRNEYAYEASRCLQCGCCLEVCPNFMIDNGFTGIAGSNILSRLIIQTDRKKLKDLNKQYRTHVHEGCGKSLSCVDICPANIKIEELLVRSNAIAVWRRNIKDR